MNKLSFVLLWATLLVLAFGPGSADGFYSEYLLTYNVLTDTLEYDFTINETSHIIVDAFTGLVISEDYWDGVCEDQE